MREKVFLSLFEKAQIARFEPEERQAYESSLKYYRDLKNVIDTARDEGLQQGLRQGKLDVLDDATIAQKTGLRVTDVSELRHG